MAFHHHQPTTAGSCCPCATPPYHHPTQPPHGRSSDPFLIATIVAQLLQNQTPLNKPTNTHQYYHHQQSLSSLLQRIDNLETSLHHLSSSKPTSSFTLRNAAARVIQTHFRAFLVRRSRTLRQLKHLSAIKSNLTSLKSSFSPHGFVDFDSLSHQAMDLLSILDSIQGEDKMIRDGKKLISREIAQFLELVDGVCVKRHQVLTRKMRNMRLANNENGRTGHHSRRYADCGIGSKRGIVDSEEKKLIRNLRERVERIGRMSKAHDAEELGEDVVEGFENVGDEDGDIIEQIASKFGVGNGGVAVNKNALHSNGKKRVCFVEDGNVIRVYNVDGDKVIASRDVEEIEDTLKGRQEEAQSDGEQSSQSSEGIRKQRSYEAVGVHDQEFTFPDPKPKADFSARKPCVKMAG